MSDKLKFPVKKAKISPKKRERARKAAKRSIEKLDAGKPVKMYDFSLKFAISLLAAYLFIFAIDVYFIVAVEKSRISAIVFGAIFLVSFFAVLWYFLIHCAVLSKDGVRKGKIFISAEDAVWYSEYHERFKEEKVYIKRKQTEGEEMTVAENKKAQAIVFQCLPQYPAVLEYVLGERTEAPRKPFVRGR